MPRKGYKPSGKSPGRPRADGSPAQRRSEADPSRQKQAPPPPSDSTVEIKESVKKAKTIKITPQLAEELGQQIALAEAIPYAVLARQKEDPRWNLQSEEVEMLARVWTTVILVYGDEIGKWVPIVALISANVAPAAARMLMDPLPKDAPGGGQTTAKDRAKVNDIKEAAKAA